MDNERNTFSAGANHSKTDSTVGLAFYQSEDGAGSLSHLQTLFQSENQERQQEEEEEESGLHRKDTRKGSNRTSRAPFAKNDDERTALLPPPAGPPPTGNNNDHYRDDSFPQQRTSGSFSRPSYDSSTLNDLFQSPASQKTPKMGPGGRKFGDPLPILAADNAANFNYNTSTNDQFIGEQPQGGDTPTKKEKASTSTNYDSMLKEAAVELVSPSTYIGGFMFVLYHVVFCLAAGSAIQRPHATNSILGLMTKMGALGVIFAGPVYLINIGNGIPSMYPTCDLFLAPLFASIAKIIDEELSQLSDISDEDNDEIFLCTFGFLAFVGMGLAGCLLILAGVFKLANLGAFLPFPVLCGFFTAVGIMTWQLGFVVDTSGKNFAAVFIHGDKDLMLYALLHHIPGVIVAVIMKYLGPKNPFYVVVVLFATIGAVYAVMFVSGTSLDEARAQGWFWYHDDIVYTNMSASVGFKKWLPPAPFGMLNGMFMGRIHWASVWKGLQPTCALSFLYLIRCALHSAALLKNVPSLGRTVKVFLDDPTAANPKPRKKTRMEMFSEIVDIEEIVKIGTGGSKQTAATEIERAIPTTWSLRGVLIQYGIAQVVSACVGSFGVIPSVATSHAMFSLKAERVAPQLCSIVMLSVFYLTDFRLIAYVPKLCFSCLLSLAFIDIVLTWFIRSYFKTKSKQEWLVVPFIVVFAFGIGLLQAVFLGIAISTFLFVGAFFRSGVVKFAASGLSIRSTIERPASNAQWLDEHGDLIQVVILQNYLFFGNASSILAYCASMFEDAKEEDPELLLPPIPKFVILDMALVTGMDTSTVDIISDILNLCKRHDCKLFLSGMSAGLRSVLAHAGVKPLGGERSERQLRFFSSLDAAIGKAEDVLLNFQLQEKPPSLRKLLSLGEDSGFQMALRLIDEQNGTSFAPDLADLEEYTTPIELEPNESLYDSPSRPERGLFFIEKGVIKIERDSGMTANTRSLTSLQVQGNISDGGTISGLRMRSGSIGRDYARMKAMHSHPQQQSFRLARVGAGWVVGAVEAVSGLEKVGLHLAVTSCRMHYLSYSEMEKLEKEQPILMLRLYKLLSHIMAKQQEVTIGQLGTLHAIMSSPAQNKPIGRRAALSFQQL